MEWILGIIFVIVFLRWIIKNRPDPNVIHTAPIKKLETGQGKKGISETTTFAFHVDGLQTDFQQYSRIGEFVTLWIPKTDYPDKVYIYHKSAGPHGYLGLVPPEHSHVIISHLKNNLEVWAVISELTDKTCKIDCKFVSRKESVDRRRMFRETEEAIAKAKDLEKSNGEEAVCLYRNAMGILRKIDQQCGKGFITAYSDPFRTPIPIHSGQ